jgi:hypothetical protein
MEYNLMSQVILVCTADKQNIANQAALEFDPSGGLNTFTVGLNASGLLTDPITHYWCAFWMSDPELSNIRTAAQAIGVQWYENISSEDILTQLGLKRIG